MVFMFVHLTNKAFLAQYHFINTLNATISLSIRKIGSQSKNLAMEKIIAIGQMLATNDKAHNRQQVQKLTI